MKENMKNFLEAVKSNEELKAKLDELGKQSAEKNVERIIGLASEYGMTLTEEDFAEPENGELSEDELEGVSGGIFLVNTTLEYRNTLYSGGSDVRPTTLEHRQSGDKDNKGQRPGSGRPGDPTGPIYTVC